jgi:N-acetylglucosamine kinase-like BadF-type ATPase
VTLIAVDIGGTGSRASIGADGEIAATGPGVALIDGRADYTEALDAIAARLVVTEPIDAVVLGATGVIAHGDAAATAQQLRRWWPSRHVVVASDALTALVGAWGIDGGAVVVAGTGAVALGTDLADAWARADGWGPLIGDRGSGSWIGAQALDAAMRRLDGRRAGSSLLLEAARSRFGEPRRIPVALRESDDVGARLAGFVPDVVAAAAQGDSVADTILADAAGHLADAADAVLVAGVPARVALLGGIALIERVASAWTDAVRSAHPSVDIVTGAGTPLDGAVALGRQIVAGEAVASRPPYISHFSYDRQDLPEPTQLKGRDS